MNQISGREVEQMVKDGNIFAAPAVRVGTRSPASGVSMAATGRRGFSGSWGIASLLRSLWLKI